MIWQFLIGLLVVIAVAIALFVGVMYLIMKVIPLLATGLLWLGRLVLHFVDWVATTILLPLLLPGLGGGWIHIYLVLTLALALLSTLGVIRNGRYNLGSLFGLLLSPLALVLGAIGLAVGAAGSSLDSCGGKYTGPEEGADPLGSSDDYGRSIGARYVANRKTGVVFDVSDPAAKTVSFRHRKYMDHLPHDLDERGYRMKRGG